MTLILLHRKWPMAGCGVSVKKKEIRNYSFSQHVKKTYTPRLDLCGTHRHQGNFSDLIVQPDKHECKDFKAIWLPASLCGHAIICAMQAIQTFIIFPHTISLHLYSNPAAHLNTLFFPPLTAFMIAK